MLAQNCLCRGEEVRTAGRGSHFFVAAGCGTRHVLFPPLTIKIPLLGGTRYQWI
jgi:hypothetical protein